MKTHANMKNTQQHDGVQHGDSSFFIIRLNAVDYLTLLGALLSCISIALMLNGKLELSLGVLYLAVIADAFDGVLARRLKLERDFGRYLDGFVDTLDYLFAPALFVFLWGFDAWYQGLLLVLFIMCGFIRLSIFNQVGNISGNDTRLSYWGAPVFWSTLVLGPLFIVSWYIGKAPVIYVLMLIIPMFSIAMLHNGRYYKFKNALVMLSGLLVLSLIFFIAEFNILGKYIITALVAIIPLAIGGALHMVVVKNNFLPKLAIPINKQWFGASKTWRGFIFMPLFTVLGFSVVFMLFEPGPAQLSFNFSRYSPIELGLMLGFAYVFAELPNSFIKRRMGIPAGTLPQKNRIHFILADQLDSVIGCGLVYVFVMGMPFTTLICFVLIGLYIAFAVKSILFHLGYKTTRT